MVGGGEERTAIRHCRRGSPFPVERGEGQCSEEGEVTCSRGGVHLMIRWENTAVKRGGASSDFFSPLSSFTDQWGSPRLP